jgi:hypothetical protein
VGRNNVVGRACRDPVRRPVDAAAAPRQLDPTPGRDTRAPRGVSTSATNAGARHPRPSRGLDKRDQRRGTTPTHVTRSRRGTTPTHVTGSRRQAQYGARQGQPTPGRDRRARHGVSTSSTNDGARYPRNSRRPARTQPPRRSSLSRPGETIYGCRGSASSARPTTGHDTRAPRGVSTSSTDAGARYPRNSRRPARTQPPRRSSLSRPGETICGCRGSASYVRTHLTGSRQARPTFGCHT